MLDFSCAVESKILLHGRMYITDKFICFYSNFFGFEKKVGAAVSFPPSLCPQPSPVRRSSGVPRASEFQTCTLTPFPDLMCTVSLPGAGRSRSPSRTC